MILGLLPGLAVKAQEDVTARQKVLGQIRAKVAEAKAAEKKAEAGVAPTVSEGKSEADKGSGGLEQLAWMVGEWVDRDESSTIHTQVKWAKNSKFLIRSFSVQYHQGEPFSGMQIIAWDEAEKKVRSWTYDSHGGFGEEFWSRAGNRWTIRSKFTLPDGGRASGMNVMTQSGPDAFLWKSVNRVIDGSPQPDIDEVLVERVKAGNGNEQAEEAGAVKPEVVPATKAESNNQK